MSKDPPPSLRNLQSSKFELAQDLDRIIENNSVLSKVIYIYSSFFKTQLKLKPLALALLIATLCPLSQGDLINSAKATQTPSSWLYFDTTGGTIKDQDFSGLSGDSSYDYGGAIHSEGPLNVQGNVSFSGNTTLEYGGAIYSSNTVTLSGGLGEISFLKNSVSLNSGAIYANASMIDGMIERINEELGKEATVIATGGLSAFIVPHCKKKIIYDDNLLLKGLQIIYNKNK